jgi:2-C-methyl-D-erythritol 4-phosphate cytidylyltransferase
MLAALATHDVGGILAVPVADTLKRADAAGQIQATEARENLWQAQTPQMFRHGLLLRALGRNPVVTDEAGAIEALGLKPKLVQGSSGNLKVTYAEDLQLAEAILASLGRQA